MLEKIMSWTLPALIAVIAAYGFFKKVRVFDSFRVGAKKGLHTVYEILPTIVCLVVAVNMFTESGAMDLISDIFKLPASLVGVPKQVVPLSLMSSVSGGGSLTVFENLLKIHGPDSFVGQVASVISGSTETTIYAITVYFSAVEIKNTRHSVFVGFAADFAGLVLSSWFVNMFM